jgi:hypothetical protein
MLLSRHQNVGQNHDIDSLFFELSSSPPPPPQSFIRQKGNDIPVTGREGPQGCETSGLPQFL